MSAFSWARRALDRLSASERDRDRPPRLDPTRLSDTELDQLVGLLRVARDLPWDPPPGQDLMAEVRAGGLDLSRLDPRQRNLLERLVERAVPKGEAGTT